MLRFSRRRLKHAAANSMCFMPILEMLRVLAKVRSASILDWLPIDMATGADAGEFDINPATSMDI